MSAFTAILTAAWQKATDWTRRKEDRGFDTKPQPSMSTDRQAGPLTISHEAFALILESEVGSAEYYAERLERPTWPGGASGVTIGCGYDLGFNNPSQIRADWKGKLPAPALDQLANYSGVTGIRAKELVKGAKHIRVPWDAATAVFSARSLPRFGKLTAETFPGIEKLHPSVQGVLLSLVFNRGSSLSGDRRREMRAIRDHVAAGHIDRIPAEIRKMKRIWQGQGLDGLLVRREAEAKLIESVI